MCNLIKYEKYNKLKKIQLDHYNDKLESLRHFWLIMSITAILPLFIIYLPAIPVKISGLKISPNTLLCPKKLEPAGNCTLQERKDFNHYASIQALVSTLLVSSVSLFLILFLVSNPVLELGDIEYSTRLVLSLLSGCFIGSNLTYLYFVDSCSLINPYCVFPTGGKAFLMVVGIKMWIHVLHRIHYRVSIRRNKFFKFMITEDLLCNFIGGLAIGSSFLNKYKYGIVTSFLLLFHKIPHEIYDFNAALRDNSWSKSKILMLQLIAASSTFLGTFVALYSADKVYIEKIEQFAPVFILYSGSFETVNFAVNSFLFRRFPGFKKFFTETLIVFLIGIAITALPEFFNNQNFIFY